MTIFVAIMLEDDVCFGALTLECRRDVRFVLQRWGNSGSKYTLIIAWYE